jgi:hypothetical protein
MNTKKGIELTNEEFFFLASLFECNALIGVPDPFIGYWIEEIEGEMKRAAQSLVHKGYIVYQNNDMNIIPELLEYVKICTKTNMTLWLQSDRNGEQKESYFYLNTRRVIESKVLEEGDHLSYFLQERGSISKAWNEVIQAMLPEEKPVVYEGVITLPLELFTDLLEGKDYYSLKYIENVLREQQVSSTVAKLLAKSIKNYEYYGQFTAFYHVEEDWRINSLRLLCTKNTNWIAKSVERQLQEYVEIYSASIPDFLEAMKSVINKSKRPSLPLM